MSYVQQTWYNGEIIAEELLNHMEAGIAECSDRIDTMEGATTATDEEIDAIFEDW